jgi:hypothetical protein
MASSEVTATPTTTTPTDIQPIPRVKQTLRYQSKEDLRRIKELRGRHTEETTVPTPVTPTTTDKVVSTAVPTTAEISTLVTTITNTGPTSITTIVDNTGTTTTTIISTVLPGINIKSTNAAPVAVASTQLVINIDSDSNEELLPAPKRSKTNKY